jgi:L-iditol 2-dehydrogenase
MRALSFDVDVLGFLKARTLGRFTEAAVFGGLSNLRLGQVPEPALRGPEWVRLRVLACGICGTDLATLTYRASPALEPFGSFPTVPGHEVLAQVEEVGPNVTRVEAGQRVVMDPMISCRVRGYAPDAHCASCREGRHATCELAGEEGPPEAAASEPSASEPSAPETSGSETSGSRAPSPRAPTAKAHVSNDHRHGLSRGLTIGYHADLPGGWGETMVAHESQLFPVPDTIPDRAAVLVEPLAIGLHAVLNGGPDDPGQDILVIGSGPIALGTIWALRATGFRGTIVGQTKREHEAELARKMGADQVVRPGPEARQVLVDTGALAYQPILGDEVFSGGGFPLVFDCVGNAGSLKQALRFAAPRGRVVMLGCAAEIPRLDLTFLWSRELEIRGFVGYGREEWRGRTMHTFEATLALLAEEHAPVEELVTHAFSLEDYREALSAAANHARSGAVKVLLEP